MEELCILRGLHVVWKDATQNFLSMQRLLTEQQEFMQRHAETVQSLDAEFMSHEQQRLGS